jgi:hypothetical protein
MISGFFCSRRSLSLSLSLSCAPSHPFPRHDHSVAQDKTLIITPLYRQDLARIVFDCRTADVACHRERDRIRPTPQSITSCSDSRYDESGNMIATHEHAGEFKDW